jgi:hypothetical protein
LFFVRSFGFSNSFGHCQSNFPISSDGVFVSLSSPDFFVANSRTPDVLHSNASPEANWRRLFYALNPASQSHPTNVTAHEGRKCLTGNERDTPWDDNQGQLYPPASPTSVRLNWESVSNCLFSLCIRSFWAKTLI